MLNQYSYSHSHWLGEAQQPTTEPKVHGVADTVCARETYTSVNCGVQKERRRTLQGARTQLRCNVAFKQLHMPPFLRPASYA
jgi:hypothetical protein